MKTNDVANALKNYESSHNIGSENYTPFAFKNALNSSPDLDIWISNQDIETLFQFMDPLNYLKTIENTISSIP